MVSPKKSLGQNFLIDINIAKKIVSSLLLKEKDFVVEIGPGKGILTQLLLQYPITYLGIELDRSLSSFLEKFEGENFKIIFADFLEFKEKEWTEKYKSKIILLGNIPYNLTSEILFKLIDNRKYYLKAVLMVQKEVANRLIAEPRTKDYGILTVLLQLFAWVEKLFDVPPQCFFPSPKVYSTVIRLEINENMINYKNYEMMKKIIRLAFNQRRKTLLNSLFKRMGINIEIIYNDAFLSEISSKRAEELSPEDFLNLTELFVNNYEYYV